MNDYEYIGKKQWDSYARRIEKRNLKTCGKSLMASGIARRARKYIIELRLDTNSMVVRKGWRKAMQDDSQDD